LILPLWIASMVLVWVFRGGDKVMFPVTGTTDKDADDALVAKDRAMSEFRTRLDEIAKKAEARLQSASKDQVKEFEEIKDKPLDEIAKWIDGLS
jgi:chromatin segregation and condensation protein Rec8/ScpA/Scc1 (kleisin family)